MVHIRKIFTFGKDDTYQRGIDYYNKCEYKKALVEFSKILSNKQYKKTLHYGLAEFYASQSYRNLGIKSMHETDFKEAIKYFKESLEILPQATVLRDYLGICYNNVCLYAEAIAEFEKVLSEKEGDLQVSVRLALALYNKGDRGDAIKRLEEAIASEPKHADLRYLLGVMHCSVDDTEAGIGEFKKSLEINPLYTEALRKLGLAYAARKRYDDAERAFKELVKIAPEEDSSHEYLALVSSPKKKMLADKAGEEFSKAIMISYNFASMLTPLESKIKDIGLYNTLVHIYTSILDAHPNYADFHHKLGQVYVNLRKHRDAVDEFLKAIKINPDYMHAHTSLAFTYKEIGKLEKSIEQFEIVLKKQTELPVIYFQLALLYKEKNDKARAIGFLNKALELQPDFKEGKALLKELHSK